jgi:hypothetical protein
MMVEKLVGRVGGREQALSRKASMGGRMTTDLRRKGKPRVKLEKVPSSLLQLAAVIPVRFKQKQLQHRVPSVRKPVETN